MAVIDTVRPISSNNSNWTPTGAATFWQATSDNSDSTYVKISSVADPCVGASTSGPHTPPADHERHLVRQWIRASAIGTTNERTIGFSLGAIQSVYALIAPLDFNLGMTCNGSGVLIGGTPSRYDSPWVAQAADWNTDANILGSGGALNFAVRVNRSVSPSSGAGVQIYEVGVDIDCRHKPQFDVVLTSSDGVVTGGVSSSPNITITSANLDLDGLSLNGWSWIVKDSGASTVASGSGTGTLSIPVNLPNAGNYTVEVTYNANIRSADIISNTETVSVTYTPPPYVPLAPNLQVEPTAFGNLLTWTDPGDQPYDDNYVVTQIQRSDCGGEFFDIQYLPDGLNGSYLDVTAPLDDSPVCGAADNCVISYRVRYWGNISVPMEPPANIPSGFIIGWPSTAGSIPAGWSRVTDLDGRYVRGFETDNAVGTGGNATHSHTTNGHQHSIQNHTHPGTATTGAADASAAHRTPTGGSTDRSFAAANHTHTMPATTAAMGGPQSFSGLTSPSTNTANNLPPAQEVIWIVSDGSPTDVPVGAYVYSAQNTVSGFNQLATPAQPGLFLKGAPAAGNGGASVGAFGHTHTVAAHTHTYTSQHIHGTQTTSAVPLGYVFRYYYTGSGGTRQRPIEQHSHTVATEPNSPGSLQSASGGTTGNTNVTPPYRILRTQVKAGGSLAVGIIGLFRGNVSSLPSGTVRCDGTNGTPDMRGRFALAYNPTAIGTTGGATTHIHTTPNHTHTTPGHTHSRYLQEHSSSTYQYGTPTTNTWASRNHWHSVPNTGSASPLSTPGGAGNTNDGNHVPPYSDVHFIRLEGVAGDPFDVPVLTLSSWAQVDAEPSSDDPGMDRLSTTEGNMLACTSSSYQRPRLATSSTPVGGGLPTLSVARSGKTMALTLAVKGWPNLASIEDILKSDWLFFSPWGGESGWYRPGPYSVTSPIWGVKEISVTLVGGDGPPLIDPQDYL